jgi:adenylate cyclase
VSKSIIKQAYLGDSGLWEAYIMPSTPRKLSLSSEQLEMNYKFDLEDEDVDQLLSHPKTTFLQHGLAKISLKDWALRIRVFESGAGEVTLKERITGHIRGECNASATPNVSEQLFNSVDTRIAKTRYLIEKSGYTWDVDLFHDKNEGLAIAELETSDADYPLLSIITSEVSDDKRYYNDNLSSSPFLNWQ